MMGKDFELLNHTADVGIVAYGENLSQAFSNAAKGLFSLITELDSVREVVSRDIALGSPDKESLLVEWLNELIYLFDTEYLLFKRFEVTILGDHELKARCYGEKVDSSRHSLKTAVKATTYHMLSVAKDNGYKAQVIFDI